MPKELKVVLASLFCIAGFRLAAAAQFQTYAADSLLATFEKGSKHSLKGTEITFSDVVVLYVNSKVICKSSQGNRVICDLSSSGGNNTPHVSIGSRLTITGKVRGRGLLGNVTLDNCNSTPHAAAIPTDAIPQESPSVPADVAAEAPDAPAPVAPVVDPHLEPPTEVVPARNIRRESRVTTTLPDKPVKSGQSEQPGLEIEHVDNVPKTTQEGTDLNKRRAPYALYVLLFFIGAGASSVFSNVLMPRLRGAQWRGPAEHHNSPETRQAALEALLLKSAKKR